MKILIQIFPFVTWKILFLETKVLYWFIICFTFSSCPYLHRVLLPTSFHLSFFSFFSLSIFYLSKYLFFLSFFSYLSFYRSTYLFTYNVRTYTYTLQIIFIFVYQSFFLYQWSVHSSIHHSTYLIVQFLSFDSVRTRKAMMQHLCSRNLSFTLRISDFGPMSRSLEQIQK